MSWDADLGEHSWNYTHNCNGMIELALTRAGRSVAGTSTPWWVKSTHPNQGTGAWWELLNGLSWAEGRKLLIGIVDEMRADPESFQRLTPDNKWGSYAGLMNVLNEMIDAQTDDGMCVWVVSG
jgi:hypothetical protein